MYLFPAILKAFLEDFSHNRQMWTNNTK